MQICFCVVCIFFQVESFITIIFITLRAIGECRSYLVVFYGFLVVLWVVYSELLKMQELSLQQFQGVPLFLACIITFSIYSILVKNKVQSGIWRVSSSDFSLYVYLRIKCASCSKKLQNMCILQQIVGKYRRDIIKIFGKVLNASYERFEDNNIYLMNQKREGLELFPSIKSSQDVTQGPYTIQINQFGSICTFLTDYASVQEATDILNAEFNKPTMKTRQEEPSLVDYVDQFLWDCPQSEETPMCRIHHGFPSILSQRQKINSPPSPSPSQINQTPEIEPLPLLPNPSNKMVGEQLSKDYKKNLAGYIIKKVIRIILSLSFSKRLRKLCQKNSLDVTALRNFLESSMPGLFGPNKIHQLFLIRFESERKMKEMLFGLVQRMLRRRYTLQILKEGRMRDYNSYIGVKNRQLLYFPQLVRD